MNDTSRAIIALYQQGVRGSEIARRIGCTPANVSQTLKRHLGWSGVMSPLPTDYHTWLVRKAELRNMAPAALATELLMFAIDQIEGRR